MVTLKFKVTNYKPNFAVYKTNSAYSFSKVSSRSMLKPVCGLEVCMLELLTALSHLKRSEISNAAIGPPSFSPLPIFTKESRFSFSCRISNSAQIDCIF
jgi:hypothetical protein